MNKKQEANEFVKECITTALLKMLKERDFSDITITDLVKRAGVSRISFYRNYESKEDVLRKHIHLLLKG
jgi:AcrR family transcriptional regulator